MLSGLIAGISLYYLQVYGFYDEVKDGEVRLVSVVSDLPEPIPFDALTAIDADSSPIRYRACFTTSYSLGTLTDTYVLVDNDTAPRNAPDWFDCFDAEAIGTALQEGTALAFMGQKNIHFGVDRIVAITNEGRGYVWHELNECGEKSYDGTVVGEACPTRGDQ
jgi:hypothetical protein